MGIDFPVFAGVETTENLFHLTNSSAWTRGVMHRIRIVHSNNKLPENFFSKYFRRFQVIDLSDFYFSVSFQQSVETRAVAGSARCQAGVIHKVIHRFCG